MRGLRWIAGAAAALLFCAAARGRAEEKWYMRVIARDDGAAAQAEKLRVRDAALSALPGRAEEIPARLFEIERAAKRIAPCAVEIRLWTPDEKTPPAPTVYITVGSGRGRNWWGVLYEDALSWAALDEAEARGEEPVFVWPLWQRFLTWLGLWRDQPPASSATIRRIASRLAWMS